MSEQIELRSVVSGVSELCQDTLKSLGAVRGQGAGTKTTAQDLTGKSVSAGVVREWIEKVSQRFEANWIVAGKRPGGAQGGAAKNWRWTREIGIAERNASPEKNVEKGIAIAFYADSRFCNQVPVASGLVHSEGDRKSAIDLAFSERDRFIRAYELKVGKNETPIRAACEVLQHGLLLRLARATQPSDSNAGSATDVGRIRIAHDNWKNATALELCVLADAAFYQQYDFAKLESAVNIALGELDRMRVPVFTFAFRQLPKDFPVRAQAPEIAEWVRQHTDEFTTAITSGEPTWRIAR
jgi:hypothetical protein